jgi:hypothetical protein
MSSKIEQLKKLLRDLTPDERRALLASAEQKIPAYVWNSNPLAFKAALKHVEKKKQVSRGEVRDFLRELKLVKDPLGKGRFGIMYNETGVFVVDSSKSGGDLNRDMVSLTENGRKIARLFDTDYDRLSDIEMVISRGLQQQSGGYAFLHKVGQNPGIKRDELMKKMEKEFGGKGRYFTGYYITLFSRLGLIRRKRVRRAVVYYLAVPEGWTDEPPEIENEED